ncbi:MAG: OmpH family outer membrane protein [Flavobacteriaceae bacterium]|nr:OmpH family outer membrane protein [Flavobacteriaceae bacterium]
MKKTILVILLLVSYSSLRAQIKIGLIDPNAAKEQIEEFQMLKQRYLKLRESKLAEIDSMNKVLEDIKQEMNGATDERQRSGLLYKLDILSSKVSRKTIEIIEGLNERERNLVQPFDIKLSASIEEIALEEGINMVLNPNHIPDGFQKYIGSENFIDITELVVERVGEK